MTDKEWFSEAHALLDKIGQKNERAIEQAEAIVEQQRIIREKLALLKEIVQRN